MGRGRIRYGGRYSLQREDKRSPLAAAQPSSAAGACGLPPPAPAGAGAAAEYNTLSRKLPPESLPPPVNYHFRKSLQRTHSILSYLLTTCSYREKSQ